MRASRCRGAPCWSRCRLMNAWVPNAPVPSAGGAPACRPRGQDIDGLLALTRLLACLQAISWDCLLLCRCIIRELGHGGRQPSSRKQCAALHLYGGGRARGVTAQLRRLRGQRGESGQPRACRPVKVCMCKPAWAASGQPPHPWLVFTFAGFHFCWFSPLLVLLLYTAVMQLLMSGKCAPTV